MWTAYLIDPELRRIVQIEVPKNDKALNDRLHEIIGAETLDQQTISDEHDQIVVDDGGLTRGEPIYAFTLPMQREPYAGRAVVIGCDDFGRTKSPTPALLRCLRRDIGWLGLIIPNVVWDETAQRKRAIVTYARRDRPPPSGPSKWEQTGLHTSGEAD